MIFNFCQAAWNREIPFIHYSELGATTERVVFGRRDDRLYYAYDDQLADWDCSKWESSREAAKNTATNKEAVEIIATTPRYWQEVLRKYWNDPELELGCIITAINQINGYQYLVFGYKRSLTPDRPT